MISGLGILGVLVVALWATDAGAWSQYTTSQGTLTNCASCHGGFQATPYTREDVDQGWGTDLMTAHQTVITDCLACHTSFVEFYPVSTKQSGGTGGFDLSCLGCHGRDEGGGVTGAGLRDHHRNAVPQASTCAESSCHASDPASPVGEDILPPYYDLNLAVVSLTDPCNPMGEGEDFAGGGASGVGDGVGLDNDGDLAYDVLDTIDCPEPGAVLLQCAALVSLLVIARRRGGKM
jgi:hypothetical protein